MPIHFDAMFVVIPGRADPDTTANTFPGWSFRKGVICACVHTPVNAVQAGRLKDFSDSLEVSRRRPARPTLHCCPAGYHLESITT